MSSSLGVMSYRCFGHSSTLSVDIRAASYYENIGFAETCKQLDFSGFLSGPPSTQVFRHVALLPEGLHPNGCLPWPRVLHPLDRLLRLVPHDAPWASLCPHR